MNIMSAVERPSKTGVKKSMLQSATLQATLDALSTTQDLCRMFERTPMTIHLWRKHKDLPAIVIPGESRPTIRFVIGDVLAWAKVNNIKIKPATN